MSERPDHLHRCEHEAMTYVILLATPHGWTDNLGQCTADDNRWPSEEAALAAIIELQAVGISGTMIAVPAENLSHYELLA
jgi:hypothetical protein